MFLLNISIIMITLFERLPAGVVLIQQTQNVCITFVQRPTEGVM